jgi:hypothetical protein
MIRFRPEERGGEGEKMRLGEGEKMRPVLEAEGETGRVVKETGKRRNGD